jgi:hypothetical protein
MLMNSAVAMPKAMTRMIPTISRRTDLFLATNIYGKNGYGLSVKI